MTKKKKNKTNPKHAFNKNFIFVSLACIGIAAVAVLFVVVGTTPDTGTDNPYAFLNQQLPGMSTILSNPIPQAKDPNLNYYIAETSVDADNIKFVLFEEKEPNLFGDKTTFKDTYSESVVSYLAQKLEGETPVDAEAIDSDTVIEKAKKIGQTIYAQLSNYGPEMEKIGPTIDFVMTIATSEDSSEDAFCAYNYTDDTVEVADNPEELGTTTETFVPEGLCEDSHTKYSDLEDITDENRLENPDETSS